MSTYVLMRILESAPRFYDLGIRLLSLWGIDRAYRRLAARVSEGDRVLDIGCGTGALAIRAALRGARVKAIDRSARMLEMAERRVRDAGLEANVELAEMGVSEIDGEETESYDVVMSGLCLSELNGAELEYTLGHAVRILKPGGLLLVADEASPPDRLRRLLLRLFRAPLALVTFLASLRTTHPLSGLPEKLAAAGLEILSVRSGPLGGFIEAAARKPGGQA